MASVYDLGLLDAFLPIFVWIFVFVILYALLEKTGFFGEKNWINAAIAFTVSILFIMVPEVNTIVSLITPWFIILLIFLVFLVLIFLFMGVDPSKVASVFGENAVVFWMVFIVSMSIFGYAFTQVYGEQIHDITDSGGISDDESLTQNIGEILFTPKVLGMVFLLVIAALVVRFVSTSNS